MRFLANKCPSFIPFLKCCDDFGAPRLNFQYTDAYCVHGYASAGEAGIVLASSVSLSLCLRKNGEKLLIKN